MRLFLLCLILTPLTISAQDKRDSISRSNPYNLRIYDTRMCFCEEKKDSIPNKTITPYKFTNNPIFNSLDEVPDSLLYLLPDSSRIIQQNNRKPFQ